MSTSTIATPKRPEIKTALPGPKGQEIIAGRRSLCNAFLSASLFQT